MKLARVWKLKDLQVYGAQFLDESFHCVMIYFTAIRVGYHEDGKISDISFYLHKDRSGSAFCEVYEVLKECRDLGIEELEPWK